MDNAFFLTASVPTYASSTDSYEESEACVDIKEEQGLRLTMRAGPTKPELGWPDLVVERRLHGWRLFVRADEGDELITIDIADDGRTQVFLDAAEEHKLHEPVPLRGGDPFSVDQP